MRNRTPKSGHQLEPGFSIIHSNHMEDLRHVAVAWIRRHPLKPLENELFIVQSNGMAQWLKLALAENDGCGISAAVDILLPARFLWNAYRAVLGAGQIPRESPYDKERLVWRLVKLLPSMVTDGWFAPLAHYLADDADMRKRYQLASQLADLYDQYQVYRADWLEDWIAGADRLRTAGGNVVDLPPEQAWQAQLWRRVCADVPEPQRASSRAGLHRRFLREAEIVTERPAGLPRRVIVFGISSLPKQALEALFAVSRHSQVLLFVHNPCRHYWADIIEDRELLHIERARHRPKAQWPAELSPESLHQHVNPLLAAWGKQGRDYIGLLYGYDQPETYRKRFAEIDLFSDFAVPGRPAMMLQEVQQAVLDLEPLPGPDGDKRLVSPEDHSIRFQLAYSRQREVEILQDRLLAFFSRDPDLKPQDIIVMTPRIDVYAPHIEAVFGNVVHDDPRYIPFTIADRPERASVPMLGALEMLLDLPAARLTVSELIDLLEVPAFRNRSGLAETDVPRLHQWIEGAGIRWGVSADQRTDFDLPAGIEQNTWRFGLRRMLLGYAVGAGSAWRGIEPYDEIGGLEAALVGPLDAILGKLDTYRRTFSRPAPAEAWRRRILTLLHDLFLPVTSRDQLTAERLETVLDQWVDACRDAGLDEPLALPVVRDAVMGAMHDASISQRFLAGRVNFGTLMPMRAIPFKIVCLLGMNDGEYPRSVPPPDFDLMSGPGRYRPGDRSRREDDRYLFLEALLSAREQLYISYIGRSVRDGSRRMPSVLVAQLRDYLAAGWHLDDGLAEEPAPDDRLLDHLTCQHPLQPFGKDYFRADGKAELFTYAHEWRQIHGPSEGTVQEASLEPPVFEGNVPLHHLIRFLKNPVRSFYNQRLNIYFETVELAAKDQEPFALDGLAPFSLGMQLLEAGLAADPGESSAAVQQAALRLRRTGDLPLNGFGERSARQLSDPVLAMLRHRDTLLGKWSRQVDAMEIRIPIRVAADTDRLLEDWLDGVYCDGACAHARWEYYPLTIMDRKGAVARLHPLIGLWVKHLAGCAQGMALTSCLIAPDGVAGFEPLEADRARAWLNTITEHWWEGLQHPLPVTGRSALAYVHVLFCDEGADDLQKAENAARLAYEGNGFNALGELGYADGLYLRRWYPDFDSLKQAHNSRFVELARKLYAPLRETLVEVRRS
jgi:exodeoxyribonuclease V gamma subunit